MFELVLATLAKEGEPAVAAPPAPAAPVVDAPVKAMLASLEKAEEALGCLGGGGAAVLDCAVKLAAEWGAHARGAAGGGEGGGIVLPGFGELYSLPLPARQTRDFDRRRATVRSRLCFRVIDSFGRLFDCDCRLRGTIHSESQATLTSQSSRIQSEVRQRQSHEDSLRPRELDRLTNPSLPAIHTNSVYRTGRGQEPVPQVGGNNPHADRCSTRQILGTIKSIHPTTEFEGYSFIIADAHDILGDCKLGDSIAVNGCCLTVTRFDAN